MFYSNLIHNDLHIGNVRIKYLPENQYIPYFLFVRTEQLKYIFHSVPSLVIHTYCGSQVNQISIHFLLL